MKFLLKNCTALFFLIGLASCHSNKTLENGSREVEEDGMDRAMQQEFDMTKDPALNRIPTERLAIAELQMQGLNQSKPLDITSLSWQERGPNNIGGRTRAILVDKNDPSG